MNDKTKKIVFLLFGLLLFTSTNYSQIYVSTSGNDSSNTGTFDLPFKTITKAISVAVMGDTIFVRGGIYSLTSTISIGSSKSGNSSLRYYLFAYGDERPLLDFSAMAVGSSNRGIYLRASYWYIKGIDIKGAGDNGMNISGSNNIIEFCALYENRDSGLQLSGGASNNQIINCDSYYNVDPGQGNADGFSPKLDVGTGNYFYGCRSWQNSDDGWDGYLRPRPLIEITTILENCWCFMNGYLKSGVASYGNGNGYKMGGSDSANLAHNFILKNCIAFDNRVKGFDQNNNRGSMTLYNCTGYNNLSKNYSISGYIDASESLVVKNSIVLGSLGSLGSFAIQSSNSWLSPFTPAAVSDFISVDTVGVRGPRKSDGSLPDVGFMHLASGSQFVDAGIDVGIPYKGSAPDLGAFESDYTSDITINNELPSEFSISENYPNPFNPSTSFIISVPYQSRVNLSVYDILGNKVRTLLDENKSAGNYKIIWDSKADNGEDVSSGIYLVRFSVPVRSTAIKVILMK
ncbi:MAG: right-handed parallel beta-helix repeat-containing protein [Ignavibacteriales bacterium]|nr:right-handed parallel beta-helix repeat-containing protein [Ignavibacteriales bacterium]